jgi:hypothetical protein
MPETKREAKRGTTSKRSAVKCIAAPAAKLVEIGGDDTARVAEDREDGEHRGG